MGTKKLDSLSLPLLRGILPIDTNKLTSDILAGVTLAALGIPEVMGYTKISGTPIVTGLYTLTASAYSLCPARGLPPPGRRC
jgi:MFS superfamily sulfate permease-like transporter